MITEKLIYGEDGNYIYLHTVDYYESRTKKTVLFYSCYNTTIHDKIEYRGKRFFKDLHMLLNIQNEVDRKLHGGKEKFPVRIDDIIDKLS